MSAGQRLDKWLWHARVAKTRTLAAALVSGGHVRVNRERTAKPSHAVRPGDVVTIARGSRILVLRVETLAQRRGPAQEARLLYTDLSPPPVPSVPAPLAQATRRAGSGRPTKRERRETDAFKTGFARSGDSEE